MPFSVNFKIMRSLIFLIIMLAVALSATAQKTVRDIDIVNALLGKSYYKMNATLDSLGVWYAFHILRSDVKGFQADKVYSIANSQGSVKVYIIEMNDEKRIREVMINFRHDSREQVEDAKAMPPPDSYKNGYYSTDMVYRWKSK